MSRTPPLILVIALLSAAAAAQENWPQFRGHRANGLASGPLPPTTWKVETGENVAWKTELPGLAHSSPIVWGPRVFVSTAVRRKSPEELSSLYGSKGYGAGESAPNDGAIEYGVYCLDRETGAILWMRLLHQGIPKVKRHPKSSHANATPACDAAHVVVSFGSEGLYCLDHDGRVLWKRDLGILNVGAPGHDDKTGYQWGHASSPVIEGDRVFVQCDHEDGSFLTALKLADGSDVWRVARDENSTWSTPTVCDTSTTGRPQLLVNGYKHIGGYDLATGAELWKLVGGGDVPVPTPVVAHDLVFLTSAHGRSLPLRAVSVRASGLVDPDPEEDEAYVWLLPRRGVYMQTPLVHGDLLYACSDGGAIGCYDAKTGEEHFRERIGEGSTGFSASPVAVGDQIYFSGESGLVAVLRAGPTFEIIAQNEMGEECMATPAVCDGTLFFRTRHHVVAIRKTPESAKAGDSR